MTRIYERQTQHWDIDSLRAMQAAGRARLIEPQGIWIVQKDEGCQVAVRPEQVVVFNGMNQEQLDAQAEEERYAEGAWLRHAERKTDEDYAFEDYERAQGMVSFEDAWDAADPVHAALRTLRHAQRNAYEQALYEAGGWADQIPEGRVEEICAEILAGQGTSEAAEEAKVAEATLLAKFGVI